MAQVHLKQIHKQFEAVQVIKGVDIEIPDGEFAVFVGPSGCGKSTLLRMVAGLDAPTHGDIVIGARVVNDLPPKERGISMVFQSYALYPHMTVGENMAFGLKIGGAAKASIGSKVAAASKVLGLDTLLDRLPRQLSGGQRQRVAMGRAMVRDPQVFLFDEPLSNLDAQLRVQMRAEIRALHKRLKTTSIYVTHDQIEAMTMADRIVVLRDGRVEQIGTPVELYDRPANTFVATFIGSPAMNLLPGTVAADGAAVLLAGGARLALPAAAPALAGRGVTVGVRPEHLHVASRAADTLPVVAQVAEFTGADTHLNCTLAGAPLQAMLRERIAVAAGDTLRLEVERFHLFDAATEQRIEFATH
jgi:multiple sugar transport system ATP-binding protein